jgi:hypothetical protein
MFLLSVDTRPIRGGEGASFFCLSILDPLEMGRGKVSSVSILDPLEVGRGKVPSTCHKLDPLEVGRGKVPSVCQY